MSQKFMVLEQQSGPSGQIGGILNGNPDYLHPTPKPGQMRLWCWNSIANGADGIVFFRWRSLPYGSEAHWNGLLYHDERNTWRLDEARAAWSRNQALGGDTNRNTLRLSAPLSCTTSTTSRTLRSSTRPASIAKPVNEPSTKRFRSGIFPQTFAPSRAFRRAENCTAIRSPFSRTLMFLQRRTWRR